VSLHRSRAAVAAALLAALTLVPIAAAPVLARDQQSAERARILSYWTRDRIANAKPRDFVRNPDGSFSRAKPQPQAKPGGGGSGTNVLGASWTGGGAVLKLSGKVLFTLNSGDYICSGTLISDTASDRSIVITAGHCSYDAADGGFARNWTFYPEFDTNATYTCSQSKWGCWIATALVVHNGFAQAGGFNTQATTYDWSFAVLKNGGFSNSLAETALGGTMAKSFSAPAVGSQTYNFGYPAAGKYHGYDLTYCADQIFNDPMNSNLTFGVDCDMTGGSSGGPWLGSFNTSTGAGTVDSVNSYGYNGVKKEYGPKFNSNTSATFSAALTAGGNTLVGTAP
jgi:V8-like Glu-specific endopeptidase